MSLQRIVTLFEACFREAGVFSPQVPGASLIVTNECRLEGDRWVVVCAGIGEADARVYFRGHPGRQDRAMRPLRTRENGQLSFLFVVRPFDPDKASHPLLPAVAHFASGEDIPFILFRDGSFFRASNLEGDIGLNHFRWELDVQNALSDPREEWLRKWKMILGHNPAHPPSHVHINSPPIVPDSGSRRRKHSGDELRLATGPPNPLVLVLSFAAWLRAGPAR